MTLQSFYCQLMSTTMATADRKFSDPCISRPQTFTVKKLPQIFLTYTRKYAVYCDHLKSGFSPVTPAVAVLNRPRLNFTQ